ncbi:hypothetical protein Tco_0708499 [Tanacetum coccineum]
MKWYDYSHLDEIEVCREDQQLYKFKEGDFPRLLLQDMEDMLLLLVIDKRLFQKRLMRNLEKFVGGREYKEELRLLDGQYDLVISCPTTLQVVRIRYSFPRSIQNRRDLPRDIPLVRIEFLRTLIQDMLAKSHTVKTSNKLRVLCIILDILPEHQSDTKVFTMMMEILPEPTSNKLCGNPDGCSYWIKKSQDSMPHANT